jgi:cell wall-associated NlpC family hydrolase
MNNFFKLSLLGFLLATLVGCASQSAKPQKNQFHKPFKQVERNLLSYYADWKGTPYRLGGNSRKGIDCSAFVRNAYQSVFELDVPRTTLGQAKLGVQVKKSELLAGDLVLFKTSRSVRHVGIILSGNKFMHVSEKRGVIISALDNVYWRQKYWKAVRPNNGVTI